MATPVLLELDLTRGLLEAVPEEPLAAFRARDIPVLPTTIRRLREAAASPSVGGLVLVVGAEGPGLAQAEELGAALCAFRAAGKKVVAWSESYGEQGDGTAPYLLASHADEVYLQPSGGLGLVGVALASQFVKEGLDRLGVVPQVSARKEYKSAPDTFQRTSMSDAQRESYQRLADSLVEQAVSTIADNRDIGESSVRESVAAAPLTAAQAKEHRLVDHLGYRDEAYAAARRALTGSEDGSVTLRYLHRWSPAPAERVARATGRELPRALAKEGRRLVARVRRAHRPGTVAVVGVEGAIVSGRGGGGPMSGPRAGADRVCAALRRAGRDDDVAAVVVRVSSPGGSYTASDAIHREICRLVDKEIPVVASMGQVAASGGYFVAMAADTVFASPTTLTGSIGVFAGKVVVADALAKVGIRTEAVQQGEQAQMWSAQQTFDEAQLARLDAWLDEVYADFVGKAAQGRGMAYDDLEALARGRVWTGADAHERGLVDELGGLDAAIAAAAKAAGRERGDLDVVRYPDVPALARLLPAPNSEAPNASLGLAPTGLPGLGAGLAALAAGAPESRLVELAARVARTAGLDLETALGTHGVLHAPLPSFVR
ncbi:signal peptide peptidase SppA [Nocardioidaceae bacterium]|nr:signal peptide peptidase SppA [Nocardioidaceae bacterium]